MQDKDKIRMHVNIAGEYISLAVPFDEQDFVRDTERHIAELFDSWRERFPSKSVRELLAMMTYQYASYYEAISLRQKETLHSLAECNDRLDRILSGVTSPE